MPRRTRKPEKKQIDQYDHKDASRANNPPVGLVTPGTDRDAGNKTYAYDPHIDPSLQFDPHRSQIEGIVDDALAAETIEERSLFPKQVFFLMAETKDSWSRLAKNLLAEIDVELIETYRGIESLKIVEAEQ
jgi:adenine-specific DNA-methyltransferase